MADIKVDQISLPIHVTHFGRFGTSFYLLWAVTLAQRFTRPIDCCRVGGVLRILGAHKFINDMDLRRFLLSCQSQFGGFSKFPGQLPDLYHTYYGFCAFSLLEEPGLKQVNVELGVTDSAATGSLI